MPNPTYTPEQLAPEVIKVGDKLHTALDEIAEDNGAFSDINTAVTDAYENTPPRPILIPEKFTENGTYVATDDNADGYSQVTVALPFEQKTVTPSATAQTVTPSQGYEALESVTVEATPLESVTITPTTSQQTLTPTAPNIGFDNITVEGYTPPPPLEEKDVNFYDYDGTLLYSYTAEEVDSLSELPSLPNHDYLTATGWTHTLNEIKTKIPIQSWIDVGACYNVTDGKTRLFLTANSTDPIDNVSLYFRIRKGTLSAAVNGDVIASETRSADSEANCTLTFSLPTPEMYPADYILEISFEGDGYYKIGQGGSSTGLFGRDVKWINMLRKVYIGNNLTLSDNAFARCNNLNRVVLSNALSTIPNSCFQYCASLNYITFPNSITSLNNYVFTQSGLKLIVYNNLTTIGRDAFSYCPLKRIMINDQIMSVGYNAFGSSAVFKAAIYENYSSPDGSDFQYCRNLYQMVIANGVTNISGSMFRGCLSLNSIIIPNSILSISGNAFYQCSNLLAFDLSDYSDPNFTPSLSGTQFEQSVIFYVKNQEMLNAFSNATNWSTYADRFQIKGGA